MKSFRTNDINWCHNLKSKKSTALSLIDHGVRKTVDYWGKPRWTVLYTSIDDSQCNVWVNNGTTVLLTLSWSWQTTS